MSWKRKWEETLAYLFFQDSSEKLPQTIQGAGSLEGHEALQYYRDSYYLTLQEVLKGQYPKAFKLLEKDLGESEVDSLTMSFVKKNPSSRVNLNLYGRSFPNSLEQYISLSQSQITQLQELMSFEVWKDDLERELYPPEDFSIELYQDPHQRWIWAPMEKRTFKVDVKSLEESLEFFEESLIPTTIVGLQTPDELLCLRLEGWKAQLLERFLSPETLEEGIGAIEVASECEEEVGPFFQFIATHKLLVPGE